MVNIDVSTSTYYFMLVMTIAGMIFSVKYTWRIGTFISRFVLLVYWARHYDVKMLPIFFRLPGLLLEFVVSQRGRYELSETVVFDFAAGDIDNTLTGNLHWIDHIEKGLKTNAEEIAFDVRIKEVGTHPTIVKVVMTLTVVRDNDDKIHAGFVVRDFGANEDVLAMFATDMKPLMRTLQYYRRDVELLMFENAGDSIGYLSGMPSERVEIPQATIHVFAIPQYFEREIPGRPV